MRWNRQIFSRSTLSSAPLLWQSLTNIFQRLKLTLNETQGNIFLVKDKRNSGRGISENFTTTRPPCSTKGNPVPCFRYILSHDIRIEPKLVLFFLLRFFYFIQIFHVEHEHGTNRTRIDRSLPESQFPVSAEESRYCFHPVGISSLVGWRRTRIWSVTSFQIVYAKGVCAAAFLRTCRGRTSRLTLLIEKKCGKKERLKMFDCIYIYIYRSDWFHIKLSEMFLKSVYFFGLVQERASGRVMIDK